MVINSLICREDALLKMLLWGMVISYVERMLLGMNSLDFFLLLIFFNVYLCLIVCLLKQNASKYLFSVYIFGCGSRTLFVKTSPS